MLGSPGSVRRVLDDTFGFTGKEICAAYNNDRTWISAQASGDWLSVLAPTPRPANQVPTARPEDPEVFGASSELPPVNHLYVATQWRMYDADPAAAAERFRHLAATESWVKRTYQVVTHDGRAYWWNSGGISEEWLLTRPDGEGHLVLWDTVVEWVGDDTEATMRCAGEKLEKQAQSSTMEVTVLTADGGLLRLRPVAAG